MGAGVWGGGGGGGGGARRTISCMGLPIRDIFLCPSCIESCGITHNLVD